MKRETLVLIPAFNEEERIEKVIREVRNKNSKIDILVVNDGSVDKTAKVAEENGVMVVNHPYNLGYGVAIQTGYKFARENGYEIIAQLDADGQHDPGYISKMIKEMKRRKLDVLIGSRFMEKTGYQGTLARRMGIWLFSKIVSLVTRRRVTDSTSGYQVINKRVLPFLTSNAFPCDYPDADLLIMLYFAGFKVGETPMRMSENKSGKSMHASLIKNVYYVLKMSLSIFTIIIRRVTRLSNI